MLGAQDQAPRQSAASPARPAAKAIQPQPQTGEKSSASKATPPQQATQAQPTRHAKQRITSKDLKSDIHEFGKRTNDPVASIVVKRLAKQEMKFLVGPQLQLMTVAHTIIYEDNLQQTLKHAVLYAQRKKVIAGMQDYTSLHIAPRKGHLALIATIRSCVVRCGTWASWTMDGLCTHMRTCSAAAARFTKVRAKHVMWTWTESSGRGSTRTTRASTTWSRRTRVSHTTRSRSN